MTSLVRQWRIDPPIIYRSEVTSLGKEYTSAYFKEVAYVFSAQLEGIGQQLKKEAYATIGPNVKEFNCLFLKLNKVMLHLAFDMRLDVLLLGGWVFWLERLGNLWRLDSLLLKWFRSLKLERLKSLVFDDFWESAILMTWESAIVINWKLKILMT